MHWSISNQIGAISNQSGAAAPHSLNSLTLNQSMALANFQSIKEKAYDQEYGGWDMAWRPSCVRFLGLDLRLNFGG
ncbi:hypothetical protein O77CONTIG1_00355 [Leptolyngbya sp. O-77]|nr:hypothetical protein O77CONTIG1_00355 [Leptolyngbya sp. O-77]